MEISVTYFDQKGGANTDATLRIARDRAKFLGIDQVVVASTHGGTGFKALDCFRGWEVNLVIVTITYGYKSDGWVMDDEVRKKLIAGGAKVLTSIHALGDDVSTSFSGENAFNPNQVVAETLRRFGQGMKVAVEVAVMASDAGLLDVDKEAVAIGGTSEGVDTAIVVKPSYARDFLSFEVREILAKPRFPR